MSSNFNLLSDFVAMAVLNTTDDLLLGDNYDDEAGHHIATTEASNKMPLIIIGIIVVVSFIFGAYILATKFLCKDIATDVPTSSMTSKFQGKLKSSSSIKTVKTNEVQSAPAFQKPLPSASAAKKPVKKASKLQAASKADGGGGLKGSRI